MLSIMFTKERCKLLELEEFKDPIFYSALAMRWAEVAIEKGIKFCDGSSPLNRYKESKMELDNLIDSFTVKHKESGGGFI